MSAPRIVHHTGDCGIGNRCMVCGTKLGVEEHWVDENSSRWRYICSRACLTLLTLNGDVSVVVPRS